MLSKKRRLEILKQATKARSVDAIAVMHFYNPIGKGDWYITHAEEVKDDYLFTGVVFMESYIWQEFTLSNLKKTKLPFGVKVKYNSKFKPISISALKLHINSGEDFRP